MKTTQKHFELFKKWFKRYQGIFELNNYQIYFMHKAFKDAYAEIEINQMGKVATVKFNTSWIDREISEKEIRLCALHECSHLMVSRLSWLATCRYVGESEVKEEDENLTIKLTHLISAIDKAQQN